MSQSRSDIDEYRQAVLEARQRERERADDEADARLEAERAQRERGEPTLFD